MAQRSRFFDSVGSDRTYDAAAFAQVFAGVTQTGIVYGEGNQYAVTENSPPGMSVKVDLGKAFILGYFHEVYTAAEVMTIAAAHATLPRIDRVVLRRDLTNRTVVLAVLTGTPAASPAAPALTQVTTGTYEIPIAQVRVNAAVASVLNANITDERLIAPARLGTLFDLTVGHDHNGVNSKKVDWANILNKPSTFTTAAHAASHNPGGSDALATAAPAASAVGDAAVTGVAASLARSDHKHAREAFGAPIASAVGDTQDIGSSPSVARSDHRHAREAFASPTIALGSAAAAGAATTHIRSDATIAAFDAVAPSTQAIGDAAAVGAAAFAARRDHKHAMPAFGAVTAQTSFGAASANGAATSVARSDHTHGTPAAPTGASVGAALAYDTPATADGGKRIYVGSSTPTGASEGDVWIKG